MKTKFTFCFAKADWSMARLTLCILLFVNLNRVAAQTFVDVTDSQLPGLPGLSSASVGWADYDGDKLLDVLITGFSNANGDVVAISKLYHNTGKNFEDVTATQFPNGLPQVGSGSVAWADYDGDNKPDFIITGTTAANKIIVSRLYHNTGKGFEDVTMSQFPPGSNTKPEKSLFEVMNSAVGWGDYDNDGKPDLLLSGYSPDFDRVSRLYHNTGHGFTDVTDQVVPGLSPLSEGALAWADYDGDKWLDFVITGGTKTSELTLIYHNDGGKSFHETGMRIPGVYTSAVAWGDYDNDDRPDLLLAGSTSGTTNTSKLYHNTKDGFVDVTDQLVKGGLPGLYWTALAWGDYDNDGRLDFLITGGPRSGTRLSRLYHNTNNGFEDVTGQLGQTIPQVTYGSVTWADYDNDTHLDFLITGGDYDSHRVSRLYHNKPPGKLTGQFVNVTGKVPVLGNSFHNSTAAWADFDGDKLQDFFIFGQLDRFNNAALLFHNTGNGWENVTNKLLPDLSKLSSGGALKLGSAAWGDYDKDGRPDLLITGDYGTLTGKGFSALYHNTKDKGFVNVTDQMVPGLPQVYFSTVSWADINNDGWLDFLITGAAFFEFVPCIPISPEDGCPNPVYLGYAMDRAVYENNKGTSFKDVTEAWFFDHNKGGGELTPMKDATIAWGDYNGDKQVDLLMSGHNEGFGQDQKDIFKLYTNKYNSADGYVMQKTETPWVDKAVGSAVAWGDYDGDGWIDLITTGHNFIISGNPNDTKPRSRLFRNLMGNGFEDVTAKVVPDLPQIGYSGVAWVDFDQDGRLDLFVSGERGNYGGDPVSILYRNTPTGLMDVTAQAMPEVLGKSFKSVSWADYDNDSKPDLLLTGSYTTDESGTTIIYHNEVRKLGGSESTLQLIAPLYNCQSGAFTFQTSGDDDTAPIEYMAPGITSWTSNPNQFVDAELRQAADAQPITLVARQNGNEVRYVWEIRLQCPVGDPKALRMIAPFYDCTTGAITFQTSGGNGTPIEFSAPGITAWTRNPNQFVDVELRQAADAKPLTLQARQSGQAIHYLWNLRAICPLSLASARLSAGANEPVPVWQARVSPNPVSDAVTVHLEGAEGELVRLELRDLRGQVVVEQQVLVNRPSQSERLPLGGAGTGLYLLRVSTTSRSQTLKVIKVP